MKLSGRCLRANPNGDQNNQFHDVTATIPHALSLASASLDHGHPPPCALVHFKLRTTHKRPSATRSISTSGEKSSRNCASPESTRVDNGTPFVRDTLSSSRHSCHGTSSGRGNPALLLQVGAPFMVRNFFIDFVFDIRVLLEEFLDRCLRSKIIRGTAITRFTGVH